MIDDFPELLGPLSTMSDADILRFWTIGPRLSTASVWWQNGGVGPPTPVPGAIKRGQATYFLGQSDSPSIRCGLSNQSNNSSTSNGLVR
jgi:hypothetical protein